MRFPLRAPRVGPVSWLFQSSVVSRSNATRGPRPRVEVLRLSVRASEPGATSFLSLPCQRAPAYQGLRANPRVPSHPASNPPPRPQSLNLSITQSLNLSISQSLNRSIPRTCAFGPNPGSQRQPQPPVPPLLEPAPTTPISQSLNLSISQSLNHSIPGPCAFGSNPGPQRQPQPPIPPLYHF